MSLTAWLFALHLVDAYWVVCLAQHNALLIDMMSVALQVVWLARCWSTDRLSIALVVLSLRVCFHRFHEHLSHPKQKGL